MSIHNAAVNDDEPLAYLPDHHIAACTWPRKVDQN